MRLSENLPRKNIRFNFSKNCIIFPTFDIIDAIRKDPRLWESYKANIAMAFKDEVDMYKKVFNKSYLNKVDIHLLANEAAQQFLQRLTM